MVSESVRSARIREGMARAAKYGRPIGGRRRATDEEIIAVMDLPTDVAAAKVGLSAPRFSARRAAILDQRTGRKPKKDPAT